MLTQNCRELAIYHYNINYYPESNKVEISLKCNFRNETYFHNILRDNIRENLFEEAVRPYLISEYEKAED